MAATMLRWERTAQEWPDKMLMFLEPAEIADACLRAQEIVREDGGDTVHLIHLYTALSENRARKES
jgi:hypothetical protein